MNSQIGGKLSFDTTYEGQCTLDLSADQLLIILKILGIKPLGNHRYSMFSDATLHRMYQMEGNPLHLVKENKTATA